VFRVIAIITGFEAFIAFAASRPNKAIPTPCHLAGVGTLVRLYVVAIITSLEGWFLCIQILPCLAIATDCSATGVGTDIACFVIAVVALFIRLHDPVAAFRRKVTNHHLFWAAIPNENRKKESEGLQKSHATHLH